MCAKVDGATDHALFVHRQDLPPDIKCFIDRSGIKTDFEAFSDYIAFCSWIYQNQDYEKTGRITGQWWPGLVFRFVNQQAEPYLGLNQVSTDIYEQAFGSELRPFVGRALFINAFAQANDTQIVAHFPLMLFPSLARLIGTASFLERAKEMPGGIDSFHPNTRSIFELAYERAADQKLLLALANFDNDLELAAALVATGMDIASLDSADLKYPEQLVPLIFSAKTYLVAPLKRQLMKAIALTTDRLHHFSGLTGWEHLTGDPDQAANLSVTDPFTISLK